MRVLTASTLVIAVVLSIAALRLAEAFVVPTILAGLIALALSPLARRIEGVGAPSSLAAFALVFGAVGAAGVAMYMLAPSYEAMARRAPEIVRDLERMAREIEQSVPEAAQSDDAGETGGGDGAEDDSGEGIVASGRAYVSTMLANTPWVAASALYCVVLAAFVLAERERLERAVLASARGLGMRLFLARAMRQIRRQVATYLLALSTINIGLGLATFGVLYALGVDNAALWGAAMALFNYIPYLGPLIVNAALLGYGLATEPWPEDALVPVLALACLNTIEGNFVTPNVVGRRMRLGAVAVFIGASFGAWLWGAPGALLATPALLVLRTVFVGATSQSRGRGQGSARASPIG